MAGWGDWYDDDDDDKIPEIPNITEEVQKNCYHRWVVTGYGPNNKDSEPWKNCDRCGMKKEDYDKQQKGRDRKFSRSFNKDLLF